MYTYPEVNSDALNPKEVYEVKILLAYFLSQTEVLCTPDQLEEIATGEGVVDYFLYTQAVKEMLGSGVLTEKTVDGSVFYELSDKGKNGASDFKSIVPKSVRDKIYSAGIRLFARLKNENTVVTDIEDSSGGCIVSFKVADCGVTLIDLKLFTPDRGEADHIVKKIKADPPALYSDILKIILNNDG